MNNKVWICHVCFRLSVGGVFNYVMNLYHNIDKERFQFAFVVQRTFKYDYDDLIEKTGGKIFYVSDLNKNKKAFMSDLYRIFSEHPEFTIVHCHMNYYNYYPLLIAKQCGIKIRISHNHTAPSHLTIKTRIKYFIYQKLIKRNATVQLACSKKAGDILYKKNYIISKNGIDVRSFAFNSEKRSFYRNYYNLNNKIVLGHISNFSHAKNIDYIIDIFKCLNKNTYALFLVGSGDQYEHILERVKKEKLDVVFSGLTSNVNEIIHAIDICLFPSLFEGFGITAVESQAAGIFTLCSDNVPQEVDCTDIIKHISLHDQKKWIESIESFKNNVDNRQAYNAYVTKKGFDASDTSRDILNLYYNEINIWDKK